MTAPLFNNLNGPFANVVDGYVYPQFLTAMRAPTTQDIYNPGTRWQDNSANPFKIYETTGAGVWISGGNAYATTTEPGLVTLSVDVNADAASLVKVPVVKAIKDYVDGIAISGSPVSTETTAGIGQLATDAEAIAGTPSTGLLALFVTPSNLTPVFGSPPALGGTVAAAGTFTDLTADGTGAVSLGSATAADITVATGDLTLTTTAGSFVVSSGESAADAVKIESTAGGVQILASGAAAGEDIVLTATGSSIRLTATESATDSINIESTLGGINILASGAAAGEDINITATGSSINITATENVANSIVISSSNGGIDITAASASAGEDIDITASGSSINIVATENAAQTIYLHADGGTSETIEIRADQGTGVASVALTSDVGGITLTAGLGTADAINIVSSDAAGGIDIDSGTGGLAIDTTGSIVATSTANSAASIFLHANGGTSESIRLHADQGTAVTSLDLLSDVGGITLRAGLGNADAINITATNAAGGIDIDAGTAGIIADTTGSISLDSAAASNFTVTGAFDLTLSTTAGSLNLTSGEDAADAIVISSGAGGIDILATGAAGQDIDIVNTGGSVNISSTENDSGAITVTTNGGTSERITVTCSQGTNAASIGLVSTAGGITLTGGLGTADAINLNTSNAAGGIDIDAGTGGVIVDTTGAISLDSATASNLTVTGAADLTVNTTAGSLILRAGESAVDAVVLESTAGGVQILASGAAAGEDILMTATGSSITITATENVTDALNLTASGAASRVNITAGTGSIKFASGLVIPVTSKGNADTPYTVLGTDYFIACDTSGGVLQVTLPAATSLAGRTFVIRDVGGAAAVNNITINGGGTNLVGGGAASATKVLSAAYSGASVYSDGTVWAYSYVA